MRRESNLATLKARGLRWEVELHNKDRDDSVADARISPAEVSGRCLSHDGMDLRSDSHGLKPPHRKHADRPRSINRVLPEELRQADLDALEAVKG